jgi:hypothetical protein
MPAMTVLGEKLTFGENEALVSGPGAALIMVKRVCDRLWY